MTLCACSVAVWRYLRARYRWVPDRIQPVTGPDLVRP